MKDKSILILLGIVTLFSCNDTKRNAKRINQHIEIKSPEKSTEEKKEIKESADLSSFFNKYIPSFL